MPNIDRDYEKEFMIDGNLEAYKNLEKNHNGKVEYANGTILLSSSTSINHNILVQRLIINLGSFFKGKQCRVFSEAIEVIINFDNNKYNFKPDVFVICKNEEGKFNKKGQSIIGVPNLIFEVVSKGNANHDTLYKRKAYAECGVKEYCLVYQDGIVEQLELKGDFYEPKGFFKEGEYESIVFEGLKFSIDELFDDLEIE
ncbi:MAG: Uma2 family endonuclease [Sarcina sp.]